MDFASVALVDARGWILLQERDEHPVIDPEKWGFPGGGVEPGEEPEAAAYRELEEETGVSLRDGLVRFDGFDVHRTAHTSDRLVLYAAWVGLTDDDVECHEGRQMLFVDPARALALDLTEAAAQVLPVFLASDLYQRWVSASRGPLMPDADHG